MASPRSHSPLVAQLGFEPLSLPWSHSPPPPLPRPAPGLRTPPCDNSLSPLSAVTSVLCPGAAISLSIWPAAWCGAWLFWAATELGVSALDAIQRRTVTYLSDLERLCCVPCEPGVFWAQDGKNGTDRAEPLCLLISQWASLGRLGPDHSPGWGVLGTAGCRAASAASTAPCLGVPSCNGHNCPQISPGVL